MTSDKRDDKLAARAREKAENLYERLGPNFRTGSPNYLTKVKSWIERDPVEAYDNVRDVSRGADFNQSRVNQQKAQARGVVTKQDIQRRRDELIGRLISSYGVEVDRQIPKAARSSPKKHSLGEAAYFLFNTAIPKEIKKTDDEASRYLEDLQYLQDLSFSTFKRRVTKVIKGMSA